MLCESKRILPIGIIKKFIVKNGRERREFSIVQISIKDKSVFLLSSIKACSSLSHDHETGTIIHLVFSLDKIWNYNPTCYSLKFVLLYLLPIACSQCAITAVVSAMI